MISNIKFNSHTESEMNYSKYEIQISLSFTFASTNPLLGPSMTQKGFTLMNLGKANKTTRQANRTIRHVKLTQGTSLGSVIGLKKRMSISYTYHKRLSEQI